MFIVLKKKITRMKTPDIMVTMRISNARVANIAVRDNIWPNVENTWNRNVEMLIEFVLNINMIIVNSLFCYEGCHRCIWSAEV